MLGIIIKIPRFIRFIRRVSVESVRNLILAGADPFAIGHLGKTPPDKLCEYENPCGNFYFSEGSPTFEILKLRNDFIC